MRLWTLLVVLCLGASAVRAAPVVNAEQLRTYGKNSSTLMYVFTSPSCPHCAAFHEDIMPTLIRDFADKGLAQIKVVDMGHDARAIGASKLARCMNNEQYGRFMQDVYQHQGDWAHAKDYEKILKGYAAKAGLNTKSQERCLSSESLEQTILEQRNNLAQMYRIQAMPSVVIVQGIKSKTFIGADPRILPEIKELFQK